MSIAVGGSARPVGLPGDSFGPFVLGDGIGSRLPRFDGGAGETFGCGVGGSGKRPGDGRTMPPYPELDRWLM
jgi:hypothetical protein